VGGELVTANHVDELVIGGLEEQVDPGDVMLCGVGMGDLFAHADLDLERLPGLDAVSALDHGNMLLRLPICLLNELTQ